MIKIAIHKAFERGIFSFGLCLFFMCCQGKIEPFEKSPDYQGRQDKAYVNAIMNRYLDPRKENKNQLPPSPLGISYFTIDAKYKSDTLRILIDTVSDLVKLSRIADSSTDSVFISKLVKGESLLHLNDIAFKQAFVIKHSAKVDSVKSKGKDYTVNYYFKENGWQRKPLNFPDQAYLIDALSDWGLLIYQDDYSGVFHLTESPSEL